MRIAFYSFPNSTAEIEVYSRLGNIDVQSARCLADKGQVTNAVQIGFYLSGDVSCSGQGFLNFWLIFARNTTSTSKSSLFTIIQYSILKIHSKVTTTRYPMSAEGQKKFKVSVMFDRCKITKLDCECSGSYKWCLHTVALCFYRINHYEKVQYRPPVTGFIWLQITSFILYLS